MSSLVINQLNVQSGSAESETFRKEKAQKQREKDSSYSILFTWVFSVQTTCCSFSSQGRKKVYFDDEDLAAYTG